MVESVSISEADAILQKDNPLPRGHSPLSHSFSLENNDEEKTRTGKYIDMVTDADKVFIADLVQRADIVVRLKKTPSSKKSNSEAQHRPM